MAQKEKIKQKDQKIDGPKKKVDGVQKEVGGSKDDEERLSLTKEVSGSSEVL